jgi:ribonuclease HI
MSINNNYVLFFDGCSKNNPGVSGAGAVLYKNGKEMTNISHFLGLQTNNYAEYMALKKGLELAVRFSIKNLIVKGDSNLVINQMTGEWKVKHENLIAIHKEIKQLETHFHEIQYEHVKREYNKRADELANQALMKSCYSTDPLDDLESYSG